MAQARRKPSGRDGAEGATPSSELRVIGGKYRGAKLSFELHEQLGKPSGGAKQGKESLVTRPMKHRTREAIFNLVGPAIKGTHAVDLFAGTGALGIEAISRGSASALFIERHVPMSRVVEQNIGSVGLDSQCEVLVTSAFLWSKRDLPAMGDESKARPWVVFVSPPYEFFVKRQQEMLDLIGALAEHAPAGSMLVVEADARFDFEQLPGGVRPDRHSDGWDVREYSPAVVGMLTLA